jgi:hypothetical protein
MLVTIRAKATFANVTSLLALFIALGGTSYTALTITGKNGTTIGNYSVEPHALTQDRPVLTTPNGSTAKLQWQSDDESQVNVYAICANVS